MSNLYKDLYNGRQTVTASGISGANDYVPFYDTSDADDHHKKITFAELALFCASNTLPSQTGNAGKILQTDGTAVSWVTFNSILPTQATKVGFFLQTDGTTASWSEDLSCETVTATIVSATIFDSQGGFSQVINPQVSASAAINWDLADSPILSVNLAENSTLNNPTSLVDYPGIVTVQIVNTGSFTLVFGSAFEWAGGAAPTATVSSVDIYQFLNTGTALREISRSQDIS